MKFPLPILAFFLSTIVSSEGLSLFGNQKALSGDGGSVPGENPLTFCKADHSDDILLLEHVDLTPNPPQAGQSLRIEAVGTLLQDVEKGAYITLQVKYGLIRLVNQRVDLCEQVSNVDLDCPVKKGEMKIVKDVDLPKEIPPGKYNVFADAYTADDKKIVCLEAEVTFKIK